MIKTALSVLGIFLSCFLSAQQYNGTYALEMKFDMPGMRYEYTKCSIVITDNTAVVAFEYKMEKAETAATNYVMASGSGNGSLSGENFEGKGTAKIQTYEKGVMDTQWDFALAMNGKISMGKGGQAIMEGRFSQMRDGQSVKGTFIATRESRIWLKYIKGDFSVLKSNETTWIKGTDGMTVSINDKVKTEDNTRVELWFTDGSFFKIKSNTILTMMNGGIQLQVGECWFNLQKQANTFQIVTPTGILGVLGTEFTVAVEPSGDSYINLLRGRVSVKDKNEKVIVLEAGQAVAIATTGIKEVKAIDVDKVSNAFEDSDNPITDGGGGSASSDSLLLYVGLGLAGLILIILILVLVFRKSKRKKNGIVNKQYRQETTNSRFQQPSQAPVPSPETRTQADNRLQENVSAVKLKFCMSCGKKLNPDARFCTGCGKKL